MENTRNVVDPAKVRLCEDVFLLPGWRERKAQSYFHCQWSGDQQRTAAGLPVIRMCSEEELLGLPVSSDGGIGIKRSNADADVDEYGFGDVPDFYQPTASEWTMFQDSLRGLLTEQQIQAIQPAEEVKQQMNSAPSTFEPGNPILGVFAYLDAVLTPEQICEAATHEMEEDRNHLRNRSLRGTVSEIVDRSFRLQFWGCPLRKYLAGFRLYYHLDMADTLTVAYFLLKRGANPIDALTADYSLIPRGLLTWVDIDRVKSNDATKEDRKIWWPFRSFYEQGDRLIEYYYPGNRGYLLVRGDRLVWEDEAFHGNVVCPSLRFQVEDDHFLALGGTRGFLNGDFVWPDPDWVNPVTDEEEWAAGGKRQRGIMIPATPGTTQCSIE